MGAGSGILTESSLNPDPGLAAHAALSTGVHGAGASTLATAATLATHAALAAGVHKVIASGLLSGHATTPVWYGTHVGFADTITRNASGDYTISLAAAGHATLYVAICTGFGDAVVAYQNGAASGSGNKNYNILMKTYTGATVDGTPKVGVPIASDAGAAWIEIHDLS